MKYVKYYREENKSGFNLLLVSGIVLPFISPFIPFIIENRIPYINWVNILLLYLIYWILIFPCLLKIHFYSVFLFRASIVLSIIISAIIALKKISPIIKEIPTIGQINYDQKEYYVFQIQSFIISLAIFWIIVLISIWVYEGYLITRKKIKRISTDSNRKTSKTEKKQNDDWDKGTLPWHHH